MERFRLLWWTYAFATTPLVIGSIIFFLGFYARRWYAIDAPIEGPALCALLLYFLFGVVTVVLCVVGFFRERSRRKRLMGPLFIVAITLVMVDLYANAYDLGQRAFVRFDVKGSGITEITLWSAHFKTGERITPDKGSVVLSFHPTYVYDWGHPASDGEIGGWTGHSVDPVFIEMHHGSTTMTFQLPMMEEEDCLVLTEAELMALPRAKSMEEVYGKLQ